MNIDLSGLIQPNLMSFIVGGVFVLLFVMLWSNRHSLDCTDLITNKDGKLSRTAIGQTFGIIVAIWAPVYTTMEGKLEAEVLAISLAYLGLVEGYSKYLRWKSDQGQRQDPAEAK
jgi:hypothetical protein